MKGEIISKNTSDPQIALWSARVDAKAAFRSRQGGIRIFRPDKHAARLNHSAAYVSLPSVPEALFLKCAKLSVAVVADQVPDVESGGSLYIRPFLTAMTPHYIPLPSDHYVLYVFAAPLSSYLGKKALDALVEENFDHAAPNGVGSAKLGSNYGPLMKHDAAAKSKGYQTTLHLDALTHTEVEEFGTAGFVGIKKFGDATTLVVPDSKAIIQSITVDSCVQIAHHFGWKVEKRAVSSLLLVLPLAGSISSCREILSNKPKILLYSVLMADVT